MSRAIRSELDGARSRNHGNNPLPEVWYHPPRGGSERVEKKKPEDGPQGTRHPDSDRENIPDCCGPAHQYTRAGSHREIQG